MHPAAFALALAAPIIVPLGDRALPLRVAVEVRTEAGETAPPLAWWSRADGGASATAAGPGFVVRLRLDPGAGGARVLSAEIHWTHPAGLERAVVRLSWPGAPRAVGRDLSFAPVAEPVRIGRGTPLVVEAGDVALAGGPGLAGARISASAGGRTAEVELLLDDAAERPFATYAACLEKLPPPSPGMPMQFGALEHKEPHLAAGRRPGDVDAARATLYPIAEGAPFLPVVVERWPGGARAAVVFTDHADRTDPDALRAVLWGHSRAGPGTGSGFLGRGVRLTKTFFAHDRRGGLDDPEIRPLADDLLACGSEVGLHSITGDRDDRDAVRAGLASLAPWRPVTWIDHEPYTNCEAISSEGWRDTGPYGIRDLLAGAGLRWIWAAGDVGGFGATRVVNVLGGAPGVAHPAIYPLPHDPRLWVFQSSMFYGTPEKLAAAMEEGPLLRLEAERGLFVAHTYLSASARTTSRPEHLARLVVRELPGGALELNPAFDAALARLAAHVRAGVLSTLTWAEAGDRLRAVGAVEVRYRADGTAEVANRGAFDLPGLTLAVPAGDLDVAVEGARVKGMSTEAGRTRVWLDLPAGGRVQVRAARGDAPAPVLPPPGDALGAR